MDEVTFTKAEVDVLRSLVRQMGEPAPATTSHETWEDSVRKVVREEIASLAGKAMRRLQDENFTRSFEHNAATDAAKEVIGHFWAEVLAEYGGERAS